MHTALASSLALATTLMLGLTMGPAAAQPDAGSGSPGDSQATITLDDCVVESSKDISYIAYSDDGTQVDKDESIDGASFDLTQVDGIEDVDSIEVKSGTTVESFAIDCGTTTGGDETDTGEDDGTDNGDEDTGNDNDEFSSQGNSQATITLDDCVVESSKDISYIAYSDDGTQVDKDESIDGASFDLTQVDGIEDVDSIEVKSGTTVESFAIDCGTTTGGDETDTGEDDETDTGEDDTDSGDDVDSSEAQISVSGCVVESSKDISYIAYMQDGEEVDRENINATSYDLAQVDGIEDVDSIEVKSGTTVETFTIDCSSS